MKKFLALLVAAVMVFSLCACSSCGDNKANEGTKGSEVATTAPVDPNLINWQDLPDPEIVGAWKDTETEGDEVILFTPECDIRMVKGSVTIKADINYGEDGNGVKSAYTQCNVLYGQWTYTIKDDVLTVTYPDNEKVFTYKAVDYSPVTLVADEYPTIDNELVGKWANEEFADSFEFVEDGYAVYAMEFDDEIYVYDSEVLYTYSASYGALTLNYVADNTDKEIVSVNSTYTIEGDKLTIDGNEYTRVVED